MAAASPEARPSPDFIPLDPACEQPLYAQLAERIAAQISNGGLPAGAQVPTETQLMAAFGVSRITVRQAVQVLARNGQLVSRRGKGTFVAQPALQQDLGTLQGFQDALRSQGIEPQTELLLWSTSAGRTDTALPAGLNLPVKLRRLYRLDSQPFALVEAWLPAEAAPLGERRAAQLNVYEILQQFLGLRIARADVVVRCGDPGAQVARELGLKPRTAVLVMERTSRGANGSAHEFMRIFIVPERYAFHVSLPGPLDIAAALQPVGSAANAGRRTPRWSPQRASNPCDWKYKHDDLDDTPPSGVGPCRSRPGRAGGPHGSRGRRLPLQAASAGGALPARRADRHRRQGRWRSCWARH